MLTYLRYALAAVCFAASVGCLALWHRSVGIDDSVRGQSFRQGERLVFRSRKGFLEIASVPTISKQPQSEVDWHTFSRPLQTSDYPGDRLQAPRKRFRLTARGFTFPLWYPTLIFALAGVGVLRFRRKFSIRSALICVGAVALLLGMVVAL